MLCDFTRLSLESDRTSHRRSPASIFKHAPPVYADAINVALDISRLPKAMRDLLRAGDTLVCRFTDRLGRSYVDVTEAMRFFLSRGVTICSVIAGLRFEPDGSDPLKSAVQNALLGFMAASAQATAESMKEAQKAGIAYARQTNPSAFRGRKITYSASQLETVQNLLSQGMGVSDIAASTKLSRGGDDHRCSRLAREYRERGAP